MNKKIMLIATGFILCFSILSANQTTYNYNFDEPILTNGKIESNLNSKIISPGEPAVPYFTAKILLPYGEKINGININNSNWIQISQDFKLDFAKQQLPISSSQNILQQRNAKIYNSDNPYPALNYEHLGTFTYAGHSIAIIKLFPIKYLPKSGIVQYSSDWTLKISTEYIEKLAVHQSRMLCSSTEVKATMEKISDETAAFQSYIGKESIPAFSDDLVNPDDPHDYLIVTSEEYVSIFQTFADWKDGYGLNSAIFTIEEIYENYTGLDNAARLRNFLIDAYTSWNSTDTPLQYVLLGGDDEIIPVRKLYGEVGNTIGSIPSDLYFSEFDSDWDSNGNGVYGEYPADDVDFIPEVAIGRLPGDNETDFTNMFNKIVSYKETPSPSLEKACMVGENLNWNPVTWGGDYKDDVLSRIPENDYHFYTLYQRDGTYSEQGVFNMIDGGCGIMNHMGHTNYSILMGMTPSTPAQFSNNEFGMVYTQGCYPAAFDELTSHSGESIGEKLVTVENGLMAFVGNTRYGWYAPGSIEGASQQFDRTFFDGLYAEDIKKLGECNNYSKVELLGTVNNGVMRWCYYELILFGDPDCEIIVSEGGNFPYLEPDLITYDDPEGDNDGVINPGEEIRMTVDVANLPDWEVATDVNLVMHYEGDELTFSDSTAFYGVILPGQVASGENDPIIFHVSDDCPLGEIFFELVINSNSSSQYPFEKSFTRHFSISIEQLNWPKYLGYNVNCSPLIIDFDNDGENEVVVVDAGGNLYSIESDATVSANFPVNLNAEVKTSLAVGDINNNSEYEAVIATYDGKIIAVDNSGNILFEYETAEIFNCTPALSDINDDNLLEIIAPSVNGKLYVLTSSGDDYPGFPFDVGEIITTSPAIGDVDEDGIKDFLFGTTTGNLFAINEAGTALSDFPIETQSAIWSSPIIYNDNSIVFANNDNKFFMANGFGEILSTVDVSANIISSLIAFESAPDEFLFGFNTISGSLGLVDESGNFLNNWPVIVGGNTKYSPIAADIDDDGQIEIITSTIGNFLMGYTQEGEILSEFPIINDISLSSPVALGDLDGDGDFEIACGNDTGISIWDYKKPRGSLTPWSIYRGNIHRTGNYSDNVIQSVEQPPEQTEDFTLDQNYPNPFNFSTTISFTTKNADEIAHIKIFNIKGQLVNTLNPEKVDYPNTNQHKFMATWNGSDKLGNQVANGIYFYKLLTRDSTPQVKRLLKIR
ncbi:MAG: C25 family cysteine peptidase [Candidatus Cloacimonadota bacterium]|nr:C25 family cysteine peptidase [Candidatus Cloacimonadota bacterium]